MNISYIVCNMQKYSRDEVGGIEKENENERDETYEASNPQIDSSRTKNNYHLVKPQGTYLEFINKRIAELKLPSKPRKDAIFLNSYIVGSDGDYFAEASDQEQFFIDAVNFFAKRYGRENIISAVVHMDETNPHMHLNMVPITKNGRLSSKALHSKKELSDLQTEIYEAVGKRYCLERGKEGSQAKHLSTAEYKAKKIIEAAHRQAEAEAENVKKKAKSELTEINQAVRKAEEHFDDTLQKVEAAKAERDKIVEDRNAEADYSKALDEAKNGKFAHSKNGLHTQITALVVENKRLDTENKRFLRDNADLFNRHKGFETHDSKLDKATRAISLFRTQEPDAFARVFYRAIAVLQPFLPVDEPVANIGRNRLREIEEEIPREQQKEKSSTKQSNGDDKGGK